MAVGLHLVSEVFEEVDMCRMEDVDENVHRSSAEVYVGLSVVACAALASFGNRLVVPLGAIRP